MIAMWLRKMNISRIFIALFFLLGCARSEATDIFFPLMGVSGGQSAPAGTIVQNGTAVSNVLGLTGILPAMTWGSTDLVCVTAFGQGGGTTITGASGGGGSLNAWSRMYDGGSPSPPSSYIHTGLNTGSDGTGNDIDAWCAAANGPGSAQVITVSGGPFTALVGFVLSNVVTAVQHTGGSNGVDAITQILVNGDTMTPASVTTTQSSQVLLMAAASNGASSAPGFSTVPTGYTTIINSARNALSTSYQTDYYIGLQTVQHSGSGTISPGSLVAVGTPSFSVSTTIAMP